MNATDGSFGGTSEGLSGTFGGAVVQVATGYNHTCALLANRTVECWGSNSAGRLGDGTTANRRTPVAVPGLSGVTAIAAGIHTCALLADTTVRCWGNNACGRARRWDAHHPTDAGGRHWSDRGHRDRHRPARHLRPPRRWHRPLLGVQRRRSARRRDDIEPEHPVAVTGLSGVTAIAVGGYSTCALRADTTVRCWGFNSGGQLGDGTTTTRLTPVAVGGLSNVKAIATDDNAGDAHTCAVLADTTMRCWGANGSGQLGDGTTTTRLSPVAVGGLSNVTRIATGVGYTCALLSDGTVRCWGQNIDGELGDGTGADALSPVAVLGASGVTSFEAGLDHACAVFVDKTIRCWGANGSGHSAMGRRPMDSARSGPSALVPCRLAPTRSASGQPTRSGTRATGRRVPP